MSEWPKQTDDRVNFYICLFCRLNRGIVFNVFLSPQSLLMHEDRPLTHVISLNCMEKSGTRGIFITLDKLFTVDLSIFWFVKAGECILSVNF